MRRCISHYEVLERLGAGAMATVYLARDTQLDRLVALKVLAETDTPNLERRQRFIREAKAVSALNHPNIVTIYEASTADGVAFIAMEYIRGSTLEHIIPEHGMPAKQALVIAVQIAEGVEAAHRQGTIHRDLKPSNILVADGNTVKILDFGLAKLTNILCADSESPTVLTTGAASITTEAEFLGTPAYMSPEQVECKPVDARTDIFAFGAVLYEMLSGRRAFEADSFASTLAAVLRQQPRPLNELTSSVPADFQRIIDKCLAKRKELRFSSGSELLRELKLCQEKFTGKQQKSTRTLALALWLLVAVVGVAFVTVVMVLRSRSEWAYKQIPTILHLVDQEKRREAFVLAQQVMKYIPNDETLQKIWPAISFNISVKTSPSGADVYRSEYGANPGPRIYVGRSPISNVRIPRTLFHWTVEKNGFASAEGSLFPNAFTAPLKEVDLVLEPVREQQERMIRVSSTHAPIQFEFPGFEKIPPLRLQDYWIDKYEVTNEEFKRFVDSGGYKRKEFWTEPFEIDGRVLTWEAAIARFQDSTGQPSPKGWLQSDYPPGRAKYPVTGISWFEAAAYARFAGKALPTIWDWEYAAGIMSSQFIVPASNFSGQGISPVGTYHGLGPWGTYDMAGNAKEWVWNQADKGKRYILGGAWDEPQYMFSDTDARSSWQRSMNFGFRCVKYVSPPVSPDLLKPVLNTVRDYARERPVSDAVFAAYKSLYSYDHGALHAVTEATDASNPYWIRQTISFDAAYGGERVKAYLFLPKQRPGPLQTVVIFPGSYAIEFSSSNNLIDLGAFDFIIKSGRAVLYPIYKGTYERKDDLQNDYPDTSSRYRDHVIAWAKDLSRSIDYLESRPDLDHHEIGYYGVSWGGALGALLPAIENRLKANVLVVGGFYLQKAKPEVDQINFAPRVTAPTLMLNGRYDFNAPVESTQRPMFRLLGTQPVHKKWLLFDAGHNIPRNALIRETLDWFDRYLGASR